MAGEVASVAVEMTPYVSAAVLAYGAAVLAKVRDDAADATVGLGRRLLQRVFGTRGDGEAPPAALAMLAADPADADALGAVRLAIRLALEADAAMLAEVRAMLASGPATAVTQHVHAGRDAYVAGRDQTVVNYRRPGD
ncbi:MAG TPA: hypothetical protein VHZ33_30280 [Trebonia sp.]|jgi:hypothetical protein|nr:hypothetical protein [Trebonia sp.]